MSYNNERLFLKSDIYLPLNCLQKNDELKCLISKTEIEAIMYNDENSYRIGYFNGTDLIDIYKLFILKIIYNLEEKTDIYVGITKLLVNSADTDTYIAYETNVTDIPIIYSDIDLFVPFNLSEDEYQYCGFRKYDGYPLYLICETPEFEEDLNYTLAEITTETEIYNVDEINVKYNFIIQPVNNKEIIYSKFTYEIGSKIRFIYPDELNFNLNDSYDIIIGTHNAEELKGISFNEKANDLECEIINERNEIGFLKCKINKSHFIGKQSGYYFIQQSNHLNTKSINYEVPPIKVILNSEEDEEENQYEQDEEEGQNEEEGQDEEEDQNEQDEEEDQDNQDNQDKEEEHKDQDNQDEKSSKGKKSNKALYISLAVIGGVILIIILFFIVKFLRQRNSNNNDNENLNKVKDIELIGIH